MINFTSKKMKNIARELISAFLISLLMFVAGFAYFEPNLVKGQSDESTFEITQTVTDEITFLVEPGDIVMSPSLAGITGGTSNGATQFIIMTNSPTGFNATITASSSAGMVGHSQGGTIPALIEATPGVPDFNFAAPTNSAAFGYTINATTTGDVAQAFLDATSSCNQGGGSASDDQCWIAATTTAYTILNRSSATPASGSTSTIFFRAQIAENPSPSIPADEYTATTTITATINP